VYRVQREQLQCRGGGGGKPVTDGVDVWTPCHDNGGGGAEVILPSAHAQTMFVNPEVRDFGLA
jgi:hypothetical protein